MTTNLALVAPLHHTSPSPWPDQRCFALAVGPQVVFARSVARRILRDAELANDVVQETLMALWDHGIPEVDFRGWIARAVSNRALHMRRGLVRRSRHELECGSGPCTCPPEQPWLAREERARLAGALDALPAEWRTVLLLREVEELDYAEIARTLGLSLGTVRSRLHRARRSLREILRKRREPGDLERHLNGAAARMRSA